MFKKDQLCSLNSAEIQNKAETLLKQMTLKEKVWLLNGNWQMVSNGIKYRNFYNPVPIETNGCKRLGISPIRFTDGPRGVVMGNSTCFPVAMARGASFDRDLERRVGDVIGKEARAQGANYFAGVCINLLRHPAWGRAQETYSEDPYHLGEMGKALTESVQEHNVMVCLKHYAMNNIENSRFFVNVLVDERTLREIYLPHFKKSVIAGAASLMGAYNLYDGDQACESKKLLTEILRDEWDFEGFTISDFIHGIRNTKKAIEAGLDVEMPMPIKYQANLLKAVQDGIVNEKIVDTAVLRVIKTILVFENCPDKMTYSQDLIAHRDHVLLAREAAEKSMVLIKNQNNTLPFDKAAKKVLVLGKLAHQENTGDHGSSRIFAPYVITPLDGIKKYLGKNADVLYFDETQLTEAKAQAAEADCVIIVAGNDFSDEGEFISPGGMDDFLAPVIEGYKNMGKPIIARLMKSLGRFRRHQIEVDAGGDRKSLSLKDAEIALIREISIINPQTVVALVCGSMIMIDDWANHVPAILYSWYAGMEGGAALARVVFGEVNPCAKLPFTIPEDVSHLPYFSSTDREIRYDLYHGYSLLDKIGHTPAYPFGFGMSYTTFVYSNMKVQQVAERVEVSVKVTNTGSCDGEEVVQVYFGMENSVVERQAKLLKGFEKVFIRAGETVDVGISISLDELRYYSVEEKHWVLESGDYNFLVGPDSSEASCLNTSLELKI